MSQNTTDFHQLSEAPQPPIKMVLTTTHPVKSDWREWIDSDDGPSGVHAITQKDIDYLVGRVLTATDASTADRVQRKALKNLVEQIIYDELVQKKMLTNKEAEALGFQGSR